MSLMYRYVRIPVGESIRVSVKYFGGENMEIKKALSLLEILNDNKASVLEIAKSYVSDMLSFYHSVEEYSIVKDGTVTPLSKAYEFEQLRQNIAAVESASSIIEEFFVLDDDIAKLKSYRDAEILVPYEEPEEEIPEVKIAESQPQPVQQSTPAAEFRREEKPAAPSPVAPSSVMPSPVAPAPAAPSPAAPVKPEVKSVEEEPKREVTVGIRKVDTEDSVKAMVGYAEGSNYENPYECVYEDDVALEEQVPAAVKLFTDEPKTDPDGIIAEARMVMEEGKNYIFTGCNPSAYLNKRFEYYRIKYALKNIDDGAEPEPELEIIKGELDKIRGFEKRGTLLSVQMVEYDLSLVEKVYSLLKDFDERLYNESDLPDISRLRELMNSMADYDEKASLLTRFYKFDVVNFLKKVYNACSHLELDKDKRLAAEKERLEKESFDEIMALEKEYYNSKQGLKGKLLGGSARSSYMSKKKELEKKMNSDLEELEKEISTIVENDTKMVGKNMKLYARIDKLLKNNVLCFKTN